MVLTCTSRALRLRQVALAQTLLDQLQDLVETTLSETLVDHPGMMSAMDSVNADGPGHPMTQLNGTLEMPIADAKIPLSENYL